MGVFVLCEWCCPLSLLPSPCFSTHLHQHPTTPPATHAAAVTAAASASPRCSPTPTTATATSGPDEDEDEEEDDDEEEEEEETVITGRWALLVRTWLPGRVRYVRLREAEGEGEFAGYRMLGTSRCVFCDGCCCFLGGRGGWGCRVLSGRAGACLGWWLLLLFLECGEREAGAAIQSIPLQSNPLQY